MKVVRSLERRLERLLEGAAGKVFSGRLHPAEIAGKMAREADLARFDHETGPATANAYTIVVNPRDLTVEPDELEEMLCQEILRYTIDEGLRLEGPISIEVEGSDDVAGGSVACHVEVMPGQPVPWAKLVSDEDSFEIGRNRAVIGRSQDADVVIGHDDISRHHALVWQQGGQTWIKDLGSANGTSVDSEPVGAAETSVHAGSVIGFATHRYRFIEI